MGNRIAVILALALAATTAASALEIGVSGLATNLWFTWDGVATPTAATSWPTTNWFWGAEAWLATPIGDDSSIRIAYVRDPVLRNVLSAIVHFEKGITRIDVGPTIGFFNSDAAPFSAGLSAAVELRWPGVAYASVRSDGGLAVGILQVEQPQAYAEIAAGFYVQNAIVSGIISAKRFSDIVADKTVIDSLTRYAVTIDVFKKNFPYQLFLNAGYQVQSKEWEASGKTDTLGSVVMGIKAGAILVPGLKLNAGVDSALYVFGQGNLSGRGPLTNSILMSASLGLVFDLDTLKFEAPLPIESGSLPETPEAEKNEPPASEAADTAGGSARSIAAEGAEDKALPSAETTVAAVSDATEALDSTTEPAATATGTTPPEETSPAELTSEAEKKPGPGIGFDAGSGIYYDAYPTVEGVPLTAIFNARVALWGDVRLTIIPFFSIGAEAGAAYFTFQMDVMGTPFTVSLIDIPIRAKLIFDLGLVQIEGFGGVMVTHNSITGSSPILGFGIDVGGRAKLLGFYAEGGYIFNFSGNLQSIPRFGLGYALKFN